MVEYHAAIKNDVVEMYLCEWKITHSVYQKIGVQNQNIYSEILFLKKMCNIKTVRLDLKTFMCT